MTYQLRAPVNQERFSVSVVIGWWVHEGIGVILPCAVAVVVVAVVVVAVVVVAVVVVAVVVVAVAVVAIAVVVAGGGVRCRRVLERSRDLFHSVLLLSMVFCAQCDEVGRYLKEKRHQVHSTVYRTLQKRK